MTSICLAVILNRHDICLKQAKVDIECTQLAQPGPGPIDRAWAILESHLDELHNLDVIGGGRDACLKQQGPDDTCKTAWNQWRVCGVCQQ